MSLTPVQRALLDGWLGQWSERADYSWPLQDTVVLHVDSAMHGEVIVKATTTSHHIRRDIWAHDGQLEHMAGLVPRMLHADVEAGILVTSFLPGRLVLGTEREFTTDTYLRAGALLARFMVPLGSSVDYLAIHRDKALNLITPAAGLALPGQLDRARVELEAIEPIEVPLVLTHGDYQPRNWLWSDRGELLLIDFGRAAPRHWTSELPRLESRAFHDPALRRAFFDGLGFEPGPEDAVPLRLERLGMALGTIVWAHGIGDSGFEEEGRRMLARAVTGTD